MKKRLKFFENWIILAGLLLIINSSLLKITGNVINETLNSGSSFIGILLIATGIALFLIEKRGGLEKRTRKAGGNRDVEIVITKNFKKTIRKYPIKEIENAYKKIGTGLANEEYIKHLGLWSIRTSKGGRILYQRGQNKYVLQKFLPPSKHY